MPRFWNFTQNPEDENDIELRIEGEIIDDDDAWIYEWLGWSYASPNAFKAELAQYSGKNIVVWIDSWGGSVFAAAGIYNALKEHKGKVTVKVDGKAVSAASVIAMAGDETLMSPAGIMMIHNPSLHIDGEAKELRHAANVLDEIKETIINAYQLKTGRSRNKISQLMDEETWMSAKKAMAEGFADGMLYANTQAESVPQDSFMFSRIAIQNSVDASVKRFFEQYQRLRAQKEADTEAPQETEAAERTQEVEKNDTGANEQAKGLLETYQAQIQVNQNRH